MDTETGKQLRILYIGGNPHLFSAFESRTDLFHLKRSENGLTAFNLLNNDPLIDGIISEVYLPGMNGIEIAKMLKAKGIHGVTPFIVVSQEADEKHKKQAFEQRIDDFYDADINPEKIHSRVLFLKKYKDFFSKYGDSVEKAWEYKIPLAKRLFDIIVSSVALILLSPVILVVMLLIRLESKGKVYYTSKRVGTGYRIFEFYKLRSMRTGADSALKELKHLNQYDIDSSVDFSEAGDCPRCAKLAGGELCSPALYSEGKKICEYWFNETSKKKASSTFIKIKDDPRVTKVGKFIRNTSIDELPQLVNVLKGDMSIVGNRPLPLYEAELLTSDDWSERFMGPAGITGLWQVEKRGKKGKMSEEERKGLDNQYAKSYSFWGDIKLILRTIPALFQKENV
ncbi:MAG: sugar transferase [Bacteroidales bacterium]|nr:sugar transferase [Bacteroidales bacterium]